MLQTTKGLLILMTLLTFLLFSCGETKKEPKFIICPTCGGVGKIERPLAGIIDPNVPTMYVKETCWACDGRGKIKSPVQ